MKSYTLKYNKVPSPPTLDFAKRLVEEVRGYDEIISIGGGSTIDVAKYIARELNIKHKAIPTTAGTGSEATKYAVFNHEGKRISLEDLRFIPDEYILDPERVVSLPKLQTASTGLDALSQAIESWWSPDATKKSRGYSEEAIKRILGSLWFSWKHLESQVFRKKMLEAANYSGRAINITKTSICHAISYPITYHYNIPHGLACAVSLPYFMDYFRFPYASAVEVDALIKSIGARINIKEFDVDLIIKEALESSRSKNVPRQITARTIKNIFTNDL